MNQAPARLSRAEARTVLLAAAGVMLLTSVPYLLASRPGYAGPGRQFTGILAGAADTNNYLAQIRQHAEGRLFSYDQYTTTPQTPRHFNLLWLTLGQVGRVSGLRGIVLYHLARLLLGVALLYVVYLLAAEAGLPRRGRMLAFLLVAFSSGLGWVVYLAREAGWLSPILAGKLAPIDVPVRLLVPEANTFLSLLLSPLNLAGALLLALTYLWGLRAAGGGGWKAAVVAGIALLLLGNVHTFDVATVYPILGLWFLAQATRGRLPWRTAVWSYALIAGIGIPTVLWQATLIRLDPTWAAKTATAMPSLVVTSYVLGYGLVLLGAAAALVVLAAFAGRERRQLGLAPVMLWVLTGVLAAAARPSFKGIGAWVLSLAVLATVAAWRAKRPHPDNPEPPASGLEFLALWLVAGLLALYAPISFQRRLVEGLHLPMCLLAGWWLGRAGAERLSRWAFGGVGLAVVLVTIPSQVIVVNDFLKHVRPYTGHPLDSPVTLTTEELAALAWLGEHTTAQDAVLGAPALTNHVPAWAPAFGYAGHWYETIDWKRLSEGVDRFYAPQASVEERRRELRASGCGLVLYGPAERALQAEQFPGEAPEDPALNLPELRPVFRQGGMVIYRVSTPTKS